MLTHTELKSLLSYDPEAGVFVWLTTRGGRCRQGCIAGRRGTGKASGYIRLNVNGREYKAHRLAWFYMTGEWPPEQIDHRNMDGTDNRWVNLRLATQSQNKANSRVYANSKSGFKGVTWRADHKKWQSTISANKKQRHLGYFERVEDAVKAYRTAADELFGEYHRPA
jgi:HNH endonuclease